MESENRRVDDSNRESVHVLIAVGSNVGDRHSHIQTAIDLLSRLDGTTVNAVSRFIETSPVGVQDQPEFLNGAVEIITGLSPERLLQALKEIERHVGRVDRGRWQAREIDLDIALYDNLAYRSENLTIPHPEMHQRQFVLDPLVEIAPNRVHPILKKTNSELLRDLKASNEHTKP